MHFWPGATCCLNSSAYFQSKIKLVWTHILIIAWWISRILGSWAHFCFASNLQNNIYKSNTYSMSSDVSFLMGGGEWGPARAGQKAKERHAEMAGRSRQGAAVIYTHIHPQHCSYSYTWAYADAFCSPLNSKWALCLWLTARAVWTLHISTSRPVFALGLAMDTGQLFGHMHVFSCTPWSSVCLETRAASAVLGESDCEHGPVGKSQGWEQTEFCMANGEASALPLQ